ncbi:hypothetical protein [Streptomyces sp. NPDC047130]|uniref:hypothetical protein n=1 Tax=Streptomyces sp. NPDC047130 TaxID=3155261 RepID=UPI003402DFF6
MDQREALLSAVDRLTRTDAGGLRCEVAGHPAGHTCLVAGGSGLPALRRALYEALTARFGRSRSLAMGGYADPWATDRTGLPLLAPFGERIVEMRAWTDAGRWIGCGAARLDGGVRTVVVVAERDDPLVDLAGVTSWVDRVVAVTRWDTERARAIDWPTVEARLATPLPGDYRRLAETFGHGAFDGLLHLLVPGAGDAEGDVVRSARWLGGWAGRGGGDLWEPYAVHPAPGGLLQWGMFEADAEFFWLTEDSDPDRWPVLARGDTPGSWQRFACTTAEFVYRVLTDPLHPFSTARHRHEHRFESHDGPGETDAGAAPA